MRHFATCALALIFLSGCGGGEESSTTETSNGKTSAAVTPTPEKNSDVVSADQDTSASSVAARKTAARVAPVVGKQTLTLIRVDLSRLDTAKLTKGLQSLFARGGADEMAASQIALMKEFLDELKAAGSDVIMGVFAMHGEPLLVVPLGEKSNKAKLIKLLSSLEIPGCGIRPTDPDEPMTNRVIGDTLVLSNSPGAIQRIDPAKAVARPEIAEALAAAGEGIVQIVYLPTPETRQGIKPMLAGLGYPADQAAPTDKIRWLAMAAVLSPGFNLRLVAETEDEASAKPLAQLAEKAMAMMFAQAYGPGEPPSVEIAAKRETLRKALLPKVEGKRVTLAVDSTMYEALLELVLKPKLAQAQRAAARTQSKSNIKQLLTGCVTHATGNRQVWPPNLETLVEDGLIMTECLTNPRDPTRKPGYVYLRPRRGSATPPSLLAIYEAHDEFGNGVVCGFPDGHVEFIASKAKFDRLLKKTNDYNAAGQ